MRGPRFPPRSGPSSYSQRSGATASAILACGSIRMLLTPSLPAKSTSRRPDRAPADRSSRPGSSQRSPASAARSKREFENQRHGHGNQNGSTDGDGDHPYRHPPRQPRDPTCMFLRMIGLGRIGGKILVSSIRHGRCHQPCRTLEATTGGVDVGAAYRRQWGGATSPDVAPRRAYPVRSRAFRWRRSHAGSIDELPICSCSVLVPVGASPGAASEPIRSTSQST